MTWIGLLWFHFRIIASLCQRWPDNQMTKTIIDNSQYRHFLSSNELKYLQKFIQWLTSLKQWWWVIQGRGRLVFKYLTWFIHIFFSFELYFVGWSKNVKIWINHGNYLKLEATSTLYRSRSFLAHLAYGHVSFCHLLASVVMCRKLSHFNLHIWNHLTK